MNGRVYAKTPQFSIKDVEIVGVTLDLAEIEAFRSVIFRLAPGLAPN